MTSVSAPLRRSSRSHAVDGNTPTYRLEQNGSSGFASQTWDIAGNETNFFIRDVTNSSKLPFRIEPGSPDNVLYLDSANRVGMGTNAPSQSLHVRPHRRHTAQLLVEEANGTAPPLAPSSTSPTTAVSPSPSPTAAFSTEPWLIRTQNSNSELEIVKTGSGVKLTVKDTGDLEIDGDCIQVATNALHRLRRKPSPCVAGTC